MHSNLKAFVKEKILERQQGLTGVCLLSIRATAQHAFVNESVVTTQTGLLLVHASHVKTN